MSPAVRLLKSVSGASLGSKCGHRGLILNRIGSSGTWILQIQKNGASLGSKCGHQGPNGGYQEPKRGHRGPKLWKLGTIGGLMWAIGSQMEVIGDLNFCFQNDGPSGAKCGLSGA